jgi:spermidine/putrescine transport system ATP-binding protein
VLVFVPRRAFEARRCLLQMMMCGATQTGDGAIELQVRGICKCFGSAEVLCDVGFEAGRGEFLTLLGPSGCGKTTLLRIIAGLELADRGAVLLAGRDLTGVPANRRPVNTVFQNYALFPHLNVLENVAFGLRARKRPHVEVVGRVGDALGMLQMEPFVDRYPHQLSGGQKQRVALARALVNEPRLLLLDEPMSALDAKLRAEVQIELRRLQRRLGTTFILVTHDQDEAMTVSDRVLVMREGRIEQSGTPREVYERPVNRFVAEFLGSANLIEGRRQGDRVETRFGRLWVASPPNWERGLLAIRPERIGIQAVVPPAVEGERGSSMPALARSRSAQTDGANCLSARVREVIYRGDHTDLFVEPGSLRVRTAATAHFAPGDEVLVELPAAHLVALSGGGGA